MHFANPYLLFGLLAVSIPVLIHLFNFRKFKKIYFSNVKFLKELQIQTQKQSKLKHLIILALRILGIIALVFAFAQPFIPADKNKQIQTGYSYVSIFVDNSFSMQNTATGGMLLDEAKAKAKEIANAYELSAQFQLLTNDFEGSQQRFVNKDELLHLIDEIKPSPASHTLSQVLKRQYDLLSSPFIRNKSAYLISDFQKTIADASQFPVDSTIPTVLIPLKGQAVHNLFIDSVWFDTPSFHIGQDVSLSAKITNTGKDKLEKVPVKLMINGKQRAIAGLDITGGSSETVKLNFKITETGMLQGMVELTDFPIIYDDKFYFSISVLERISILAINGKDESMYLRNLFAGDSNFIFQNTAENKLNFNDFTTSNLIIFNQLQNISSGLVTEINNFINNGGTLAVFPPVEGDISSYNSLLSNLQAPVYGRLDTAHTNVTEINHLHKLYRNVFEKIPQNAELPKVFKHYKIESSAKNVKEMLLKCQNGDDFLVESSIGKGRVWLFATPLDLTFSDFAKQTIFVPTLYNIALNSQAAMPLYYVLGNDDAVEALTQSPSINGSEVYKITNHSNVEIIPESRIQQNRPVFFLHNHIQSAGNYFLNYDSKDIAGISFNYNMQESDPNTLTADEINKAIQDHLLSNYSSINPEHKSIASAIQELNEGLQLWKWFIILALLCLLGEVILLRIRK